MSFTPTVLFDAYISINSNVVSDHGNKVEINVSVADEDTTAFGQTWAARVGGLKDGTIAITLMNDFVASNIDSIFWPLLGTVVPFEIRPTSSAVGAGNPKYTGSILISGWKPVTGDVGKLVQVDMTFPTSGTVARATS
jgi:hypothetical protein